MEPYLLALDLDFTACDRTRHLGLRTREALAAARAAGHTVCFATGRRDIDMYAFWPESTCADYLLLNNGGKLLRAADRAVLFNRPIDPRAARTLIEYCLANGLQLHVVSGEFWAVNRWNDGLNEYVEQLGTRPVLYSALEETPWDKVEGFMATEDLEAVCVAVEKLRLPMTCAPAEDRCVDIMARGISKWDGLRRLAERLNIPRERIVAAGDYNNDIEMIRNAGIGVAVANALPEVKAAADYVTERDNDHDAAAEIVERFLLPPRRRTGAEEGTKERGETDGYCLFHGD